MMKQEVGQVARGKSLKGLVGSLKCLGNAKLLKNI